MVKFLWFPSPKYSSPIIAHNSKLNLKSVDQIWMMTNFLATVFGANFSWFLSAFPFKLYHEKLSHIFSGTCITTYTNFIWILRLMTLRLDPATIRQSFASDQNWKRMCWLASFADFHQKPEPITMSTCPHVSKTFLIIISVSWVEKIWEITPFKILPVVI